MDPHDHPDPFAGLEEWARKTERRVRREIRVRGLRQLRVSVRAAGYLRLVLAFAVAGVLLAAAVPVLRSWMPARMPAAYPTPTVPPQSAPAPSAPGDETVTTLRDLASADPFEGTPAATYPRGEVGITLPEATAVAGFTIGEVDAALLRTRAALVATRLDDRMLTGHQPDRFLAMLAPGRRAEIGTWFSSGRFRTLATWIDPAATLDQAEQPRVSGRMTYASVAVRGVPTLEVTTNFIWVYAFQGSDHPLAAAHDEIRWDFPDQARLPAADRGMDIGSTKGYLAWADCDAAAKGMLAPAPPEDRAKAAPDAVDYLRADHPLEIPDGCP
jgi:hypothetical protein